MLCEDCRFWTRREIGSQEQHGSCLNTKFVYDDNTPGDGLRYWDAESWSAGFSTGESFGCIHWKERDE